MYIAQAFKYTHEAWKYVVGIIVAFVATQLGSIPLGIVLALNVLKNKDDINALDNPMQLLAQLDSNLALFLMLLSFAVGLVILLIWVKAVHKQTITSLTTARKKIDWQRVLFSFGLVATIIIVLTVLDYVYAPENYELQFNWTSFLILAIIAIVMIPLQTSFEEYLFRGYLMQWLGFLTKNRWAPLLITSVIFGGLHYFNPEVDKLGPIIMLYYIGTGLFLGVITLMDDGLELALGFHAGNNLVAAVLVTADWTVFQTASILKDVSDPTAGADVLLPLFIMYPILLLIMAKRYKWKGWQSKLFGRIVLETNTLNTTDNAN